MHTSSHNVLEIFKHFILSKVQTGDPTIDIIIYSIIISMCSFVYIHIYTINDGANKLRCYFISKLGSLININYTELSTCSKRIISEYGSNRRHYPKSYIALLHYINKNIDLHVGLKCLKEVDEEGYIGGGIRQKHNDSSDIFSLLYKSNQNEPFYLHITMDGFKHLEVQCKMKKVGDRNNDKDSKIKIYEEEIILFSYKNSKDDLKKLVKACWDEFSAVQEKINKDKQFYLSYDCTDDDKPFFIESDLNCDKSIDDIFFEGKEALMKHYEYYLQDTNKHFNLCLHGPPGTGKTSVIQALLHLTKRHAVTINLNKIKSPEEFERLFCNLEINSKNLKPRDIIYIIEEIDGYGEIVKDRTQKFANEDLNKKVDNIVNSLNTINNVTSSQNNGNITVSNDKMGAISTKNNFNITNILNITQGVNQIQGLMIIISTNHFEYLDPALKRPGRMYCVKLNKHSKRTLLQQIKYLFKLEDNKIEDIDAKYEIPDNKFSGAEIEEFYSIYRTDIDGLLNECFLLKT